MHNNLHALLHIAVDSAEYGGGGAHALVHQSVREQEDAVQGRRPARLPRLAVLAQDLSQHTYATDTDMGVDKCAVSR